MNEKKERGTEEIFAKNKGVELGERMSREREEWLLKDRC